jgi:mRNA-degrading endonuclease HigB of HigAB toxin-antitoxin module
MTTNVGTELEFGTVSLLPDGHACCNVGGNKYRLVVV